ncbi:MAG: hypothetical protein H7Z15_06390 [Rhizobacter sp.]|nr:hypothetical protein [Rhizobacter sp.]
MKPDPEPAGAKDSAGPVLDALRNWWSSHPMHVAGVVAADAANTLIRPVAQRHPIALVFGALVLGGLVVWAKPWRGFLKPALLVGLLPQLLSKAMAAVPLESWLTMLSSLTQKKDQPAPESAPSAATVRTAPVTPDAQAPLH